ncbi:MAG: hypothetical protein ACK4FL_00070 [Microgenomates group bacterium]
MTEINVNIKPEIKKAIFILFNPEKIGVIIEAKNTKPRLAVNSDNLSSCESLNHLNI